MDKVHHSSKCVICGNTITFRYKAMSQWNISGELCGKCYEKKLTEYYIIDDRREAINRS